MEMFTSMSGTSLRHIPYKGTAQALNDLIGGTIRAIDSLEIAASDRQAIYEGNAKRLMRLS